MNYSGWSVNHKAPDGGDDRPDVENEKTELILKLTRELAEVKENAKRLKGSDAMSQTRSRDLEDILRLKEQVLDGMEKEITLMETKKNVLENTLKTRENELAAIRAEQELFPISDRDLLHRYTLQSQMFETLRDCLTCPVCYEPFGKGQAVSLQCGHSFCEPCFANWEMRQLQAFKLSPAQGPYPGADCPECRSTDVRRGRVRIWALEEVVRLVERAVKDARERVFIPPPVSDDGNTLIETPLDGKLLNEVDQTNTKGNGDEEGRLAGESSGQMRNTASTDAARKRGFDETGALTDHPQAENARDGRRTSSSLHTYESTSLEMDTSADEVEILSWGGGRVH